MTAPDIDRDAARISLLSIDQMSRDQREVHDAIVSGPRGKMIGPLRAAIHSPELALHWATLGEFLRYRTCLPKYLNELAIIVTARRWTAQVEWQVHAKAARDAGLSREIIDAIAATRAPVFRTTEERDVYEFARLLQQSGQVPRPIHTAVTRRWGTQGVVELTAVIGYYTMVAMTLNAHRIPVPDGKAPFAEVGTLVVLPPARRDKGGAG